MYIEDVRLSVHQIVIDFIANLLFQVLYDKIEKEEEHRHVWHCKTQYNTWSHQRKRRRLMEKIKQIQTNKEDTALSQVKEKLDDSVQIEDQEGKCAVRKCSCL